jgi:hypothetical protein
VRHGLLRESVRRRETALRVAQASPPMAQRLLLTARTIQGFTRCKRRARTCATASIGRMPRGSALTQKRTRRPFFTRRAASVDCTACAHACITHTWPEPTTAGVTWWQGLALAASQTRPPASLHRADTCALSQSTRVALSPYWPCCTCASGRQEAPAPCTRHVTASPAHAAALHT